MLTRFALVVLVMFLLPTDGIAGKRRQPAPTIPSTVVVSDYTAEDWAPLVVALVDDFNDMLPSQAPELIYRRMSEVPCRQISRERSVIVCHSDDAADGALSMDSDLFRGAIMPWRDEWNHEKRARTLCHEMMHLATFIRDNYNAKTPEESCVWSYGSKPGTFDRQYAADVYERWATQSDDPEPEKQRRHKHRRQ